MGIDDLLAKLERAAGTAGTAGVPADVPANPLQTLGGTAGTAGTAEKDKGGGDSTTDTAPPIRTTCWLQHYADREPMEVWFSPAVDHNEALIAHPEAAAAEPLPAVSERARECEQKSAHECTRQSAHETARQSLPKCACESIQEIAQKYVRESARKPAEQSAATGCKSCRYLKRPGLSSGYCGGGRDDLPGAYGDHHPLRRLPADLGEGCASYKPHEG